MPNINIRGLDDTAHQRLKTKAREKGISLNSLIVKYLRQDVGLETRDKKSPTYNDLDELAGTWNKKDAQNFLKAISAFEKIEGSIWE